MGSLTWRWQRFAHHQWQQEAAHELALVDHLATATPINTWRSVCPICNTTLSIRSLVPIAGYLHNKGRCEHCGHAISLRYPLIEAATTLVLLPLFFVINNAVEFCVLVILMYSLMCAFIIDAEDRWIPDECNIVIAVCSTILLDLNGQPLLLHLYTAIVCYISIALLRALCLWFRKHEAIGLGDVKLIAVLGYWLGPDAINVILGLASLTGILFALQNRTSYSTGIPFGPHLIGASLLYFYASFLL